MADKSKAIPTELGTEKIGKLLKQYALPAIIAQTASSLYNMVDSIFIGQGVGPLAISGLAVTFPLMNLSTAFGTLVGAGAATMLSVLLGQKNYKAANKVLGNVVSLNIIIGLIFMAVALIFIDPILYFFGASENTLPYAKEYISIILIGNVVTHLYFGLNAAMRSSGESMIWSSIRANGSVPCVTGSVSTVKCMPVKSSVTACVFPVSTGVLLITAV